jgi:hypothetical protein
MAYEPRSSYETRPNDPYRTDIVGGEFGARIDPVRLDTELQPDPELAEGPAVAAR